MAMRWNCFLRHLPEQPLQVLAALQERLHLLGQLEAATPAKERASLLGRIGEDYRQLGMLDEAIAHLERALELAQTAKAPGLQVPLMLRMATALQHRGEHARAEVMFQDALRRTRDHQVQAVELEDFALQHLGKCLVEMGHHAQARDCFEQALALRLAKGEQGLIASTRQALDLLLAAQALV